MKVDSWRPAENILKMKTFHLTKCKACLHGRLNTSKGVIRSMELSLAASEEITSALAKQSIRDYKGITPRKGGEEIQTNIYILSFNLPKIPKEVKSGYFLDCMEQYLTTPLKYFKCQRSSYHKEGGGEHPICRWCCQKDLDQTEKVCPNETKGPNCQEKPPCFLTNLKYIQKMRKILAMKYK